MVNVITILATSFGTGPVPCPDDAAGAGLRLSLAQDGVSGEAIAAVDTWLNPAPCWGSSNRGWPEIKDNYNEILIAYIMKKTWTSLFSYHSTKREHPQKMFDSASNRSHTSVYESLRVSRFKALYSLRRWWEPTQTEVEGNDCVSRCRGKLGQVLWLLFEFGEEGVSRIAGHTCCSLSEETTHVTWLEQWLYLLQGENGWLLLNITAERRE